MKYLVRFEDTYGVSDIFCSKYKGAYFDISERRTLQYVTDNLSIIFGISNTDCLNIKGAELSIIHDTQPEYVIIVLDLDKENNDGSGIISEETLRTNLFKTEEKIRKVAPTSKVLYIPVVYSCETVMLYQYLVRYNKLFCVETLVHKVNTWQFHAIMLAILAHCEKVRDVKSVRNYLDLHRLITSFETTIDGCPTENREVMDLILDIDGAGITLERLIEKVRHVQVIFNKFKQEPIPFDLCGVLVNSNDNLYSIRSSFPSFPKGYK